MNLLMRGSYLREECLVVVFSILLSLCVVLSFRAMVGVNVRQHLKDDRFAGGMLRSYVQYIPGVTGAEYERPADWGAWRSRVVCSTLAGRWLPQPNDRGTVMTADITSAIQLWNMTWFCGVLVCWAFTWPRYYWVALLFGWVSLCYAYLSPPNGYNTMSWDMPSLFFASLAILVFVRAADKTWGMLALVGVIVYGVAFKESLLSFTPLLLWCRKSRSARTMAVMATVGLAGVIGVYSNLYADLPLYYARDFHLVHNLMSITYLQPWGCIPTWIESPWLANVGLPVLTLVFFRRYPAMAAVTLLMLVAILFYGFVGELRIFLELVPVGIVVVLGLLNLTGSNPTGTAQGQAV